MGRELAWIMLLAVPGLAQAAALPRVVTPQGVEPAPQHAPYLPAFQAQQPARGFGPGPGQRAALLGLVQAEAKAQGVPPELADAVAVVETGYTPQAIGSSGEIGLMQVMPGTAAQMGFHGSLGELADPATNIHYGVTYLARAWQQAGGNPCRALMKYRAGLGEEGYSPLSITYCRHAATWLATLQSPLADRLGDTIPAVADIADLPGHTPYSPAGPSQADLHQIVVLAGLPGVVEGAPPARPMPKSRAAASVQAAVEDVLADSAPAPDGHVVEIPSPP